MQEDFEKYTQTKPKYNAVQQLTEALKNGTGEKIRRYTRLATKAVYLTVVLIGATAIYNLFTSEISGQFKIYEKDEKTGKTELFKFQAMKSQPMIENKNLISVEIHSDGSKSASYKRRVFQVWGFQTYAGPGIKVMPKGELEGKVGITIGF